MIRKIEKKDVDAVVKLVNEYENKRLNCTNAGDLLRDEFAEDPSLVDAYVVEHPETECIVGYVIYNMAYSSWTGRGMSVVSFYVQPDSNNDNTAYKLLKALCEEAVKLNVTRIDFQVDKQSEQHSFFMKHGADDLICDNRTIYRMKGEEMIKIANGP